MAPGPLLPKLPEELAKPQFSQNSNKKRFPAANNPGDIAQFAIKSEFKGYDEQGQECLILSRGWGNDGTDTEKEYHEFKVTGFSSLIQTKFWPKSIDRSKNSFNSKFVLVGTKAKPPIDGQKVILNVFLDEDQKNILGYILVLQKESEKGRTQSKCTLKGSN